MKLKLSFTEMIPNLRQLLPLILPPPLPPTKRKQNISRKFYDTYIPHHVDSFFFFFFWAHGIGKFLGQGSNLKPLQWQCQFLNPMCHKRTPILMFKSLKIGITLIMFLQLSVFMLLWHFKGFVHLEDRPSQGWLISTACKQLTWGHILHMQINQSNFI